MVAAFFFLMKRGNERGGKPTANLIQIQYMQGEWMINSWPSIMPSLLSLVPIYS